MQNRSERTVGNGITARVLTWSYYVDRGTERALWLILYRRICCLYFLCTVWNTNVTQWRIHGNSVSEDRYEFGRRQPKTVIKYNPSIHPKTKEILEESSQPVNRYYEKYCALQQWTHLLSVDYVGTKYSSLSVNNYPLRSDHWRRESTWLWDTSIFLGWIKSLTGAFFLTHLFHYIQIRTGETYQVLKLHIQNWIKVVVPFKDSNISPNPTKHWISWLAERPSLCEDPALCSTFWIVYYYTHVHPFSRL
jgi:hypothetical protein